MMMIMMMGMMIMIMMIMMIIMMDMMMMMILIFTLCQGGHTDFFSFIFFCHDFDDDVGHCDDYGIDNDLDFCTHQGYMSAHSIE